ncbi:AAA family ATPase [Rhodopirellula sp. SWK7]|uniref:AAA family ATPase n=1 Tax=Rhodopirellula sp. SWK7 TaxID=595460 RepID=UPI0002BE60FC|nr:AAA family ATPase [Rhodopirellula sp. SWK7]EMI44898.1 ATPase, AAA family [Rhodopirellula sp. SWK7]
MKLSDRLVELVKACFTGLWVESVEHEDAIAEIAEMCRENQWRLASWDIDAGLRILGGESVEVEQGTDPLAAIRATRSFASDDTPSIVVLRNFHRFLGSAEIMQSLARQVADGRNSRTVYLILSPTVQLPIELEKSFVVVEHPMPTRQQLREIAEGVATEDGELPSGDELETVLDAAMGLTRLEAENAFGLSLVRDRAIRPESIWELKASTLKKSGLIQLYKGKEDFSSLGGLENLKAFCKRSLLQPNRDNPLKRPRGVLLLGVPGTGKSAFAKALGKETGRPVLVLDIGALMGSLVGQTEQNVRRALQIADASQPCILFADEIEKSLSGATSSGQGDSGVSSRMLGTLLSWMNDHTSNVYLIATCNDVSRMPPELTRAERFDGIVFLDLPGRPQKDQIWEQYIRLFELDGDQSRPEDEKWTGAEIRSCCRLAALLDLPLTQAALNVVPIAVTANESVESLRRWASGRCLNAEAAGLYQSGSNADGSRRRSVTRSKPSNN